MIGQILLTLLRLCIVMLWLWHISRNVAVNIKRACDWHVYQNSQVLWNADLIIKNNYRLITSSKNLLGIHFYVKYVTGLHSRLIALIMWFISVTHQTHYYDVIMSIQFIYPQMYKLVMWNDGGGSACVCACVCVLGRGWGSVLWYRYCTNRVIDVITTSSKKVNLYFTWCHDGVMT